MITLCLQILQEDEDSLSANQKTEVSPVSQAWFTTKEDKDTLANKGTNEARTSVADSECSSLRGLEKTARPKRSQTVWKSV